ncbi:MAG: PAS domain S-box protein [Bacteroidales bacterium]
MPSKSNSTDSPIPSELPLQDSLTRLHDLLVQIIDSSPRRIIVVSGNSIVYANPPLQSELGYNLNQLVNVKLDDIVSLAQGGNFMAKYLSMEVNQKKRGGDLEPVLALKSDGKQALYTPSIHRCLWEDKPAMLLVLSPFISPYHTFDSNEVLQNQSKKRALSASKVYYWDHKLGTDELNVSPTFFDSLNLSSNPQNINLNTWVALLTPESRKQFSQLLEKAKARKETHFQWVYTIYSEHLGTLSYLANFDVVEWNNLGNPSRIAGVHISINTKSNGRHITNNSDKALTGLINNMNEGLIIIDRQGIIREWNPAQEKITHIKRNEAIGKHVWILYHSLSDQKRSSNEYINQLNALFDGISQAGESSWDGKLFEMQLIVGGGVSKLVQHSVFTINSKSHADFVVAITTKDITETKQNQQKIERNEKRLRIALSFSKVGIWDIDFLTHQNYFSPMMFDMFGYRPYEFEPSMETIQKIVHPLDSDLVNEHVKALRHKGTNFHIEFRALRTDGQTIWVECKTHVIKDERNKTIRIMGIISNISRQKTIENALRANEQILTQSLEQQHMVANIAYELNINTNFDDKISYVLSQIGTFIQASRVYIFENNTVANATANTYEWCKPGVKPQKETLQSVPLHLMEQWLNTGYVKESNDFEKDLSHDLAQTLKRQNIQSILMFRLFVNDSSFGFIGFDECDYPRVWTQAEKDLLKTISNLLAFDFHRRSIL